MRMLVRCLAPITGLRIPCCCQLWRSLQKQLRSGVAVAVVSAGSCSSDLTFSLGICHMLYAMVAAIKRKEKSQINFFPVLKILYVLIFGPSLFCLFVWFLGLHPQPMKFSRLEVESELQLPVGLYHSHNNAGSESRL